MSDTEASISTRKRLAKSVLVISVVAVAPAMVHGVAIIHAPATAPPAALTTPSSAFLGTAGPGSVLVSDHERLTSDG